MSRIAAQGDGIVARVSRSNCRHSRENGKLSDLRYVRCAKSGGQAPALRAGVSRTGKARFSRIEHILAMREGAPPIRFSRESENPFTLSQVRNSKSGGQAPAPRAGVSRTGEARLSRIKHILAMRECAPPIRHSRENGNPSASPRVVAPGVGDKPPRYPKPETADTFYSAFPMRTNQWAL